MIDALGEMIVLIVLRIVSRHFASVWLVVAFFSMVNVLHKTKNAPCLQEAKRCRLRDPAYSVRLHGLTAVVRKHSDYSACIFMC